MERESYNEDVLYFQHLAHMNIPQMNTPQKYVTQDMNYPFGFTLQSNTDSVVIKKGELRHYPELEQFLLDVRKHLLPWDSYVGALQAWPARTIGGKDVDLSRRIFSLQNAPGGMTYIEGYDVWRDAIFIDGSWIFVVMQWDKAVSVQVGRNSLKKIVDDSLGFISETLHFVDREGQEEYRTITKMKGFHFAKMSRPWESRIAEQVQYIPKRVEKVINPSTKHSGRKSK